MKTFNLVPPGKQLSKLRCDLPFNNQQSATGQTDYSQYLTTWAFGCLKPCKWGDQFFFQMSNIQENQDHFKCSLCEQCKRPVHIWLISDYSETSIGTY